MTLSTIQKPDASQLLDVWNAAAEFDALTIDLLGEKLWGDLDFDSSLALAWREGASIKGFGVAVCRHSKGKVAGYIKLLAMAPELQRRGIGTKLCDELERECQQRGVTELRLGESAPNYLTPGVDMRYRAASEFFEQRGFASLGEACNMLVDLDAWSAGRGNRNKSWDHANAIRLERATPARREAIKQFLEVYWPTWWAEVSTALENAPATLHLAIDGDEVVGFAAHDANNRGTGWFGPMGTAPSQRGKGIGAQLLARCLDDMHAAGFSKATIPWVGPVDFYHQQVGATVARTFQRYSKPLEPLRSK